jgi:hypothetical protein
MAVPLNLRYLIEKLIQEKFFLGQVSFQVGRGPVLDRSALRITLSITA